MRTHCFDSSALSTLRWQRSFLRHALGQNASGDLLCADAYDSRLREAVRNGAPLLKAKLNAEAQTNTAFGEARTFYFSAQPHGHQFFVESDGLGAPKPPLVKP